jgi:hypothetical protein
MNRWAWPTLGDLANLKTRLASYKRMILKALANLANLANLFSPACARVRAYARARARAYMNDKNKLSRLARLASTSNTKGCSWPTLRIVGWTGLEGWPLGLTGGGCHG